MNNYQRWFSFGLLGLTFVVNSNFSVKAAAPELPRPIDQVVDCDLLVAGGGLAGSATAYEGLLAGKTICLTEITDWVGGQISSQGTSALDERATQRSELFFPRGYLEFRERIEKHYGKLNPGDCWVSESCFFPDDGHNLLFEQLKAAEKKGKGKLHWFPSTVIKDLTIDNGQITSAIAIQHQGENLADHFFSEIFQEAYRYEDSANFKKTVIQFNPPKNRDWYVFDATETGELIAIADVPYRLGIDPRSANEPSSASVEGDPYCTQGFTYTFAMEQTEDSIDHEMPSFYPDHAPYYSYELERLASFDLVFTYRRIWSPKTGAPEKFRGIDFTTPTVGDISMQNWTWGNDYRPGTAEDNLIYTREQLEATNQLNDWQGGLRPEALATGEDHALGYFYWLVAGTTDSQLGSGVKELHPNHQLLTGADSPMGTTHGLSKHPYMREGRRMVGRPSYGYPDGFMVSESDISRQNYTDEFYSSTLTPEQYRTLQTAMAGSEALDLIANPDHPFSWRSRSTIFPDSVGIGHYAIDFHPCMTEAPAYKAGNTEREGERQGAGQAYPFQIPLRAMIPQNIDNMLVVGKAMGTSHIAAAAYRVHSFEWSSGAAGATTAIFALDLGITPASLVDDLPRTEPQLRELQKELNRQGNPTAFPGTSVFNEDWSNWR